MLWCLGHYRHIHFTRQRVACCLLQGFSELTMISLVSAAGLAYLLAPRCAPPRMEATTATTLRPDIAAELGNLPTVGMLDEAALLAKNAFVIPPDELIALAKAFTAAQLAGTADGTGGVDWFASDFRFVAPVVGPFDKSEFVDSLKSFDLKTAFPTLSSNYHRAHRTQRVQRSDYIVRGSRDIDTHLLLDDNPHYAWDSLCVHTPRRRRLARLPIRAESCMVFDQVHRFQRRRGARPAGDVQDHRLAGAGALGHLQRAGRGDQVHHRVCARQGDRQHRRPGWRLWAVLYAHRSSNQWRSGSAPHA